MVDPKLLKDVRHEVQENLSFTPKETDIYKIHQSGDLANLDGLDGTSLQALPSLKKLRDALYSYEFRDYLCNITGSKAVSGRKTDMAINVYTPGCHLLCHDDVIGSRRISYILYLTDPDRPWKADWGGALRLYPTEMKTGVDGKETIVPCPDYSKSIPPAFNQLSFFAVQPGQSFHDVEEVYSAMDRKDTQKDEDRVRMAISGWYHVPQKGENGYSAGDRDDEVVQSSLAQLEGSGHEHDRPQGTLSLYAAELDGQSDSLIASENDLELSESDLDFLLKYIAPTYLTPDVLSEVSENFSEDCSIVLDRFLSNKFCDRLRDYIQLQELGGPSLDSSAGNSWETARPPHKHCYLFQQDSVSDMTSPLQEILKSLIPSHAFSKWMHIATGYKLRSHNAIARRFRRAKDYTLAQSYQDDEPRLEACLSLTPTKGWGDDSADVEDGPIPNTNRSETEADDSQIAENRDVGGYLAYMAGDNDDVDEEGSNHGIKIPKDMSTGGRATQIERQNTKTKADPAIYRAQADEDDGVLFSMPPSWNRLGIVLRDKGTMRFVKYVSRSAKGDRWDVFGEFGIDTDDIDEEDSAEEGAPIKGVDDSNDETDDKDDSVDTDSSDG